MSNHENEVARILVTLSSSKMNQQQIEMGDCFKEEKDTKTGFSFKSISRRRNNYSMDEFSHKSSLVARLGDIAGHGSEFELGYRMS
jgi:hypothetical protein